MQTGQLSASTSIDNSSFVSGGSKQAAPIKTAIIRPTNFYDGNRRLSFGASPGSKVKLRPKVDQQTGYSSPVNCSSDMSPLTPGADSDPLSDNGAVMYGTNATCRRRSKVEAWMEMSSPTLTDNSFEDSGSVNRQAYKRQAMKLSATSTLSREDIELSFENLCQELLALSASCTNLEGTIGKAESESGNAAFKRPTLASTNGESTEAANKQLAVDISDRHCVSTSLLISPADAKEMGVTESGSRQNLKSIQEYEDMKSTENNSFTSSKSTSNMKDMKSNGFTSSKPTSNSRTKEGNSSTAQSTIVLSAKKMTALTIDVGGSKSTRSSYMSASSVPIRDSLVTITSPAYRSLANRSLSLPQQPANMVPRSKSYNPVSNSRKEEKLDSPGDAMSSLLSQGTPKTMETKECLDGLNGSSELCINGGTDHVAAAITTQHSTNGVFAPKSTNPRFHRSVSEPSSFLSLTPSKRATPSKTSSKKDVKCKQVLRIGMDYIRPKENLGHTKLISIAKDNQIKNNLDGCNSPKTGSANSDKIVLLPESSIPLIESDAGPCQPRLVFSEDKGDQVSQEWQSVGEKLVTPVYSSTQKSMQFPTSESVSRSMTHGKGIHESLSSSFESEALDIVASLKSAGALKAHLRHGKFPIDVDPITGSPRQPVRCLSEEKLRLSEVLSHNRSHQHSHLSSSTKSSCVNSPGSASTPQLLQQSHSHRSPLHSQIPFIKRCRQSCYDNVLQSPYPGVRISVASGSSSGTVFSRPWGDLPRWDDFQHNDDFRHRVGSAVSSQGRSSDGGGPMGSPIRRYNNSFQHFKFPEKEESRSPSSFSRSVSEDRDHFQNNLISTPRFPLQVSSLPDVALHADVSTLPCHRPRSNWETSLDRALNKVRTVTKLLHSTDSVSCEITRYTQQLLSDSNSLPGNLIGRFHTCTWETNSLDRGHLPHTQKSSQTPQKSCLRKESEPKTNWYPRNRGAAWTIDKHGMGSTPQAYSNDAYLLNTGSKQLIKDGGGSSSVKEHIVLSNVRQFIDGMKRFLLNRPDTQMMFAIQRERIKLNADEFINLDSIMEAVLEKVILQPLSDHLLNVITTNPEYSIREITLIESGTKVIANNCADLFPHLSSAMVEIDGYDNTLRSVLYSVKSEFSPISKLQYLLQIALLLVLICNRCALNLDQDLLLMFIYTVARYGDATLLVHLAYVRHLVPAPIKSGTTIYFLGLYETAIQVCSRIAKVPGNLTKSTMILNEILDKMCCHLMIADESTNKVIRKKMSLSRWCSAAEVMDIIQADLATPELNDFRLYLATDEAEVLLKDSDIVSELLVVHTEGDKACALVYRRTNSQMLLPPP